MTLIDRLTSIVSPVVTEAGAELFDLEYRGGTLIIQVTQAGGINLDRIAEITSAISRVLDDRDPIPGRYTLEVSSPGLERTLRTAAHFRSAIGEQVTVKMRTEVEGRRRFAGVLRSIGETSIGVEQAGAGLIELPLELVDRARTVFEWGPTPKPGSSGRSAPAGVPTNAAAAADRAGNTGSRRTVGAAPAPSAVSDAPAAG